MISIRSATLWAACLLPAPLWAGGIERGIPSMAFLFEEGTYLELTFTYAEPEISGVDRLGFAGGAATGNTVPPLFDAAFRYRQDLTERLSFGLVYDHPLGADFDYPLGTGYYLQGSSAGMTSQALSALFRYEFADGVSVYGGLRVVEADGEADIFFPVPYSVRADGSTELGYLLGVAYERPDYGLRVALTYQSATEHSFDTVENGVPTGRFSATVPQAITLEAQTGIAPDTLLIGGVRWVEWSEFAVATTVPLVAYEEDIFTYALGGVRRLSEAWAATALWTHEPADGNTGGALDPTDGRDDLTLALTWTGEDVRLTGALTHSWIGDAEVDLGRFSDNTSLSGSLQLGIWF
ncbi:putative outer membrane protein [Roseibacterium elongatum DSM 19469]|uniref:Putative outer membrane protein n=1 Tax=Roseicyclus elongatus DSM 19469 TaxID=1294273 RepID=W8SRM5_9RHOB|nr:hypothetical protein [Roseibacterium elongatum]AHM05190.1 putative outer membrane protein [Roseibacterium elongatum DSM 19469]